MHRNSLAVAASLALSGLLSIATSGDARSAENAAPGAGNALAIEISGKSALVRSAKALIDRRIREMENAQLRTATEDAVDDPATCVRHRAGVDATAKAAIIERLKSEGLVDPGDEGRFAGGLSAGIFPPLKADGGDCPQLPQAFTSAPGSVFGGHHSYPGGLAIHEAFNLSSALSLAANYRRTYGHRGASGLPEVGLVDHSEAADNIAIDQDIMIAAPIWHDWAKAIVFQWTETGDEFPELNFGGNGKTDKFGGAGNSKTGAHHILGVAETIKRGLPPQFVITQASAHAAPAEGSEFMVVNWIRAAAVIAQVDPVAAGYLIKDPQGRPRLPPLRRLAELPIQQSLPDEPKSPRRIRAAQPVGCRPWFYRVGAVRSADRAQGSGRTLRLRSGRRGGLQHPVPQCGAGQSQRRAAANPLCGWRRRGGGRRNRTTEACRDYLKLVA